MLLIQSDSPGYTGSVLFCVDCTVTTGPDAARRTVATTYDAKHGGEVCPKCERVYSPLAPAGNRHYATDFAYRAALKNHADRKKLSVSHAALIQRILRPKE